MALANRFDFQAYPDGQHGGLTNYPCSGIVSGVKINSATASGTNITCNVTAGSARLDSVLLEVPALTGLVFNTGVALTTPGNDVTVPVYLNPIRKVKAVTTLPGSPVNGDKVILVVPGPDANSRMVQSYMKYNGLQWVSFNPIQEPPDWQHNNLPLHTVLATTVTAAQFSNSYEPIIYHKKSIPVYVSSPSNAYLRQSASVQVAEIKVIAGATPAVTVTTYDDSTIASI